MGQLLSVGLISVNCWETVASAAALCPEQILKNAELF